MGRYYGECLRCHTHVRNGHGRSGPYTYCPPCCVARNACKECAGVPAELDPQSRVVLGGSPYQHDTTAEPQTRVETHGTVEIIGGHGVGE